MGLFFKDYESAGVGISKHAPKKKGISLLFDILLRKFWKLMGLNFLYMLFFIPLTLVLPVITFVSNYKIAMTLIVLLLLTFSIIIGPATAAMMRIMRSFVIEKHTFILRDFFRAFKSNFKKAAIVGFFDCLIALSVYASLNVYPALVVQFHSKLLYVPMILTMSIFLVTIIMNYYIYLMMIATKLSLKNLIKNSFALAFVAMKQNLLTLFISVILIVGMILLLLFALPLFLVLILISPAAFIFFVTCFNCYPVIQKYVINPYYTSIGEVNPELINEFDDGEEAIFEDMGGKEKPIEKRKKGKGKRIS